MNSIEDEYKKGAFPSVLPSLCTLPMHQPNINAESSACQGVNEGLASKSLDATCPKIQLAPQNLNPRSNQKPQKEIRGAQGIATTTPP